MKLSEYLTLKRILHRDRLYVHEIISILIFSIFGNLIFSIELNFNSSFDVFLLLKVFFITSTSVSYYLLILRAKELVRDSDLEYKGKTDPNDNRDVDDYYAANIDRDKGKFRIYLWIAVISTVLYFFLKPLVKLY